MSTHLRSSVSQRAAPRRSGTALIDMLLTIHAITLLLAMLLPSYVGAREEAEDDPLEYQAQSVASDVYDAGWDYFGVQ